MKKILILVCGFVVALVAWAQEPVPPAATPAEVAAGTDRYKRVTPYGLANSGLVGSGNIATTNIVILTKTGIARGFYGRNITNAINAAQAGDTVFLPPGTYVETVPLDIPHGVHLKGSGIGVTIITNSVVNKCALVPGSGSVVSDFSYYQEASSRTNFQFGFGTAGTFGGQKFFTNALLERVYWNGETDVVYVKNASYSTLKVRNIFAVGRWDWALSDGTNTIEISDCDVVIDNQKSDWASFASPGWSWLANGCVVGNYGKISMSNVRMRLIAPPWDFQSTNDIAPEIRVASSGTDGRGIVEMVDCVLDITSPSAVRDFGFLFPTPCLTLPDYHALSRLNNADASIDGNRITNSTFINVSVGFSNRWATYTMGSTNTIWNADSYYTNVFGPFATRGVLFYGQSFTNRP